LFGSAADPVLLVVRTEWTRQVTVDERLLIRDKIKAAYVKQNLTVEELLDITSAIEEELLFGSAPSRLDYYKSGVQFEKRVSDQVAIKHLKEKSNKNGRSDADEAADNDDASTRAAKRAKEGENI
jgi:hypothetical protein